MPIYRSHLASRYVPGLVAAEPPSTPSGHKPIKGIAATKGALPSAAGEQPPALRADRRAHCTGRDAILVDGRGIKAKCIVYRPSKA